MSHMDSSIAKIYALIQMMISLMVQSKKFYQSINPNMLTNLKTLKKLNKAVISMLILILKKMGLLK